LQKAKTRILNVFDKAKAVILVPHDISIVKELCTRVIWLKKGQIIADGPTQPVLDRYWADLHGWGEVSKTRPKLNHGVIG
jgi:ABC-type polysaccharide/polyol phosphate transport system ATPase subunit